MTILERISRLKKARKKMSRESEKLNLLNHSVVIFLGIILSVSSYLIIVKTLNLKFTNPPTTTVSWFTVNNYPRQQDYFYFFTSFILITSVTCLIWCCYIWLKKSK